MSVLSGCAWPVVPNAGINCRRDRVRGLLRLGEGGREARGRSQEGAAQRLCRCPWEGPAELKSY